MRALRVRGGRYIIWYIVVTLLLHCYYHHIAADIPDIPLPRSTVIFVVRNSVLDSSGIPRTSGQIMTPSDGSGDDCGGNEMTCLVPLRSTRRRVCLGNLGPSPCMLSLNDGSFVLASDTDIVGGLHPRDDSAENVEVNDGPIDLPKASEVLVETSVGRDIATSESVGTDFKGAEPDEGLPYALEGDG